MPDTWTIKAALEWCIAYLEKHDDEHPRRSAEWLLSAATGLSRVELYAFHDRPLTMEERDTLRESLRRRGAGEPLQYVTGEMGFRHIVIRTAPGVLIPRPETEMLVQAVLDALPSSDREDLRVLEVGTGTGCIALSLAHEAGVTVVATDISPDAVACATRNCSALGLDDLVHIVNTDCAEGIEGPFDVFVSNPPYIPTGLMDALPGEVTAFEPHLALDGGEDGLEFFDRLVSEAPRLLAPGALFACELHETCLDEAAERLRSAGFHDVEVIRDLTDRPRIVTARLG